MERPRPFYKYHFVSHKSLATFLSSDLIFQGFFLGQPRISMREGSANSTCIRAILDRELTVLIATVAEKWRFWADFLEEAIALTHLESFSGADGGEQDFE